MPWGSCGLCAAVLLTGLAHAEPPAYGKVDTFQPGKKYNCVPTADHKAWDCNEAGKTTGAQPPRAQPAEAAPPAAALPAVAPASAAQAAPAPKASALPSYLTNAAASGRGRAEPIAARPKPREDRAETNPAPAAPAAPVAPTPPVATQAEPKPAAIAAPAAPAPQPSPAPVSEPTPPAQPVSAPPPASDSPPPVQVAAPASADGALRGNREFLALPPASYVVEVAHSADRAEIAALGASLHIHLGELYELHLTRDGADWWLLVWGHFGDIESARAARSDLPADAAVNAGWPRRIAPLQAEARKSGD